jgi:LysM repeat protein
MIFMMKTKTLLWVCWLLWLLIILTMQPASAESTTEKKGSANEVIALVNQVRVSNGLVPYQVNNALMASAQAHSNYQASIGSITHTGAGGSRPVDRAVAAGYGGGMKIYISENIYGGNNATPQQAVTLWKGDSLHLNTMISPNYTDIGVGVAVGGNTVYYTLDAGYITGSPGAGSNPTAPVTGGSPVPTRLSIIPVQLATPGPDGSIVHIVEVGQALWNIAAAYKVPLSDLLTWNDLTKDSFIHPGDKIIVRPAGTITSTVAVTVVPSSTTLPEKSMPTISASIWATSSPEAPSLILGTPSQIVEISPTPKITPMGNSDNPGNKPDIVLWGISGMLVLGTSLILAGSVMRRRSS